jgi:hypothetical protein
MKAADDMDVLNVEIQTCVSVVTLLELMESITDLFTPLVEDIHLDWDDPGRHEWRTTKRHLLKPVFNPDPNASLAGSGYHQT